ncbi:MAG: hemolysin [Chloroflexi bacterium]|nr:hemolysin [Chloroflexota bacterium]
MVTPTPRHGLPRPPGLRILGVLVLIVGAVAALYWYDQSLYVSTDQAMVVGVPVFVSSPAAGQIRTINVNVGDDVTAGQLLATVALGTGPNMILVPLRSPIDGVVVARAGNPGDAAAPGRAETQGITRPILTLIDPNDLWIEAPIDETWVGPVRPGQRVEVTINTLWQVLPGRVVSIGRASTEASALLRQGNAGAANGSRATPLVPVRIEVGYGDLPLFVGASASVRIRVQGE